MIVDGLVQLVLGVITALVNLIPTFGIDWASATAGGSFGTLLQTANMFLPISELLALVRLIVGLGSGLAAVWAVYKVIGWLPFT